MRSRIRPVVLLAVGWLSIDVTGAQSLELVEGAVELELSGVTFPTHAFGSVLYTPCETCMPQTRTVDSSTVYIGASGPMALASFLAEVSELKATPEGRDAAVGLFYSLSTERVTRIKLYPTAEE